MALLVHGDYRFAHSDWHLGGSYVYANSLGVNGPCGYPAGYAHDAPCSQYPPNNNYLSSDTTLPGFTLSTLAEAYVGYKSARLDVLAGDQLFSSPWAGPSDSRIKAAYYQGVGANYKILGGWTLGAARMTQWESRTASAFNKSDLIVPLAADGSIVHPTTGFLMLKAAYEPDDRFNATFDYYAFYDVASLAWFQAKWSWAPKSPLEPSIALQFGSERNSGASLVGTIDSRVFGAQLQERAGPNVEISLSYDQLPWRSTSIQLPAGTTCKRNVISGSGPTGGTGYWLPTGGTPNCVAGSDGTAVIYYGGFASPYTDSYSSSPLFTTAESQDVVERRSAGTSARLSVTITSKSRQERLYLTRAFDTFTNGAGAETTWGTDVEAEYYFQKVGKGAYHGLSLIERWAQRTQTNTALWGGTPLFNYNRVQLQYAF